MEVVFLFSLNNHQKTDYIQLQLTAQEKLQEEKSIINTKGRWIVH